VPPADEILDSTAVVPGDVVRRAFEAETLLLNLDTGNYHALNETGGRMLELLAETGGDVRAAVERLAGEYGRDTEEIAPEIAEFCRALADRGLLEVNPR
jgi:hypothetical protein